MSLSDNLSYIQNVFVPVSREQVIIKQKACDVMGDEDWAPDFTNTEANRSKEGHQKKFCGF